MHQEHNRQRFILLSLGQRLRRERECLNWTQEQLAEAIGATSMSINRWEHDKAMPQSHYREQLCRVFNLSADILFAPSIDGKGDDLTPQPVWNVPFRRNPFFTGREETITRLHETLHTGKMAALTQVQAISGLGGIGKTQIAIEYAYRYRDEYQATLWIKADTREVLFSDIAAIAELLHLPEKDQHRVVEAIKRWLRKHDEWLLILDNIEDLTMIYEVLPATHSGHILLTTHVQVTGTLAQRIDLDKMEPEEGALFLLRRAKLLPPGALLEEASAALRSQAIQLSQDMDGLPLALDQAGAYLEETSCTPSDYLELYRTRRATLLNRRGATVVEHPESVITTFTLSLAKVERANPAAADLLRLCAFLHPDAIPEEILTEGAPDLGLPLQLVVADALTFHTALGELRTYSLLHRNPETKTLTIHRLMQAVLKDSMDETMQRQWAERTMRAVSRAFPNVKEKGAVTWARCQRCLPHVHICAAHIERWQIASAEAGQLLNQAASYLHSLAYYDQAESLYQQALAIRRQLWGPKHPDVAESLNDLALHYHTRGNYVQAEPLYQQALAIRRQLWGPKHPDVAESLNDLASLYQSQGNYVQAEPLFQRALAISERVQGPEHPHVAISLYNLGDLYRVQDKHAQAEPLLLKGLAICERMVKSTPPDGNDEAKLYVAVGLHLVAKLYLAQGKYTEAGSLCQRALAMREKVLGPEHPRVAQTLTTLARLYHGQGNYMEAEPAYQRALRIQEKVLGPEHPQVVITLEGYAGLLTEMKREAEAATLLATTRHCSTDGTRHRREHLPVSNREGGAKERCSEGGKEDNTKALRAAASQEHAMEPIDRWLEACCARDDSIWTSNAAIMQSYLGWCEQQQQPMSMKALTIALRRRGFLSRLRRTARQNGSQPARGMQGIRILI